MSIAVGENSGNVLLSYLPGQQSVQKALYSQAGDVNRHNLYENLNPTVKERSKSVACLVLENTIVSNGITGKYSLKAQTFSDRFNKKGVNFENELSPGFGTAFLVAPRLALTAGHCVCKKNSNLLDQTTIENTKLIFGFQMNSTNTHSEIHDHSVCSINDVDRFSNNASKGDWALLKLNKNPEGATPLRIDFHNVIQNAIDIYMLGHPSGLPMKYTDGGKIVVEPNPIQMQAKIDAFAGNSGSPIFDSISGNVIGILVAGNQDYDSSGTHLVTEAETKNQGYEKVQRITALPLDVLEMIEKDSRGKIQKVYELCSNLWKELVTTGNRKKAIELLCKNQDENISFQAVKLALAALKEGDLDEAKYKMDCISGFIPSNEVDSVIQSVRISFPKNDATTANGIRIGDEANVSVLQASANNSSVGNNSTFLVAGSTNSSASANDAQIGRNSNVIIASGLSETITLSIIENAVLKIKSNNLNHNVKE